MERSTRTYGIWFLWSSLTAERLPEDKDVIAELTRIVSASLGAQVRIDMHMQGKEEQRKPKTPIEEILKERIHMEIEED